MRHLLQLNPRADERNEGRRADCEAALPRRKIVAHLMDEHQRDESGGVAPAPDEGIDDDRHQHRAAGGQELAELDELQAAEQPQQELDHSMVTQGRP